MYMCVIFFLLFIFLSHGWVGRRWSQNLIQRKICREGHCSGAFFLPNHSPRLFYCHLQPDCFDSNQKWNYTQNYKWALTQMMKVIYFRCDTDCENHSFSVLEVYLSQSFPHENLTKRIKLGICSWEAQNWDNKGLKTRSVVKNTEIRLLPGLLS